MIHVAIISDLNMFQAALFKSHSAGLYNPHKGLVLLFEVTTGFTFKLVNHRTYKRV
jgi:hypothetical protein